MNKDLLRVGGLLFGDPVAIANGEGGAVHLHGSEAKWRFARIRGTILGVPIRRIVVFGGLGPPF